MLRPSLARIYRGTPRNLALLAQQLRKGGLVGVPTETVYGLAANALDAKACEKIFRAKGRPHSDPLIVHVHSVADLPHVCEPNAAAMKLARRFWPGPLTLILNRKSVLPAIVSAGQPSVAVRVPSHPLFRKLLKRSGLPLAAPSANPFGYVSPTTAQHVRDGLGKEIRSILDGGPAQYGVESTIVDLRNPARPCILRPGAITREAVARTLGCRVRILQRKTTRTSREEKSPQLAPGLLLRHYSPRTPVVLHRRLVAPYDARHAYVFFRKPRRESGRNIFWLDERGDLSGAAHRLFAVLREADRGGFQTIHVESAPGHGIAIAINDRLRRAAAR